MLKSRLAEFVKIENHKVDPLYCPKEFYMVKIKGIGIGRPVKTIDEAMMIVDWFNSIDKSTFVEDLLGHNEEDESCDKNSALDNDEE